MHRRIGGLLAIATLVAGASATSAMAADPPGGMDRRGTVPADKGARAARGALEDRLGPLATVRTAPSGGVAEIGSPARLLTGRTVLLVTHDPLEALRLGHRIHVMAGQPAGIGPAIVPSGSPPRAPDDPALLARQAELLRQLAS